MDAEVAGYVSALRIQTRTASSNAASRPARMVRVMMTVTGSSVVLTQCPALSRVGKVGWL